MNLNVIKIYIKKLKIDNIKNFLDNENIIVNENELNYLYRIIKNDYDKILNEDDDIYLKIKNNINNDAYDKLIKIYNEYKNLYLN